MRTYLYILLVLSAVLLPIRSAHAISIKDIATKIEDICEKVIEVAKYADEKISEAETKLRNSKLGKMGQNAHKYYSQIRENIIVDRALAKLKVPSYLADVTTSVTGVYSRVSANYVPVYGGGNDSSKRTMQERHNMEIQHNLIADVYAKAYVLRTNLVEERKKGEKQVTAKNTRELIEVGRAYNEKIVQRYVDILNMESALLDFENTDVLMNADPARLQLAKEGLKGGD